MENRKMSLELKAELICSGALYIPPEIKLKFPTSRSSAGPGAGSQSIVICFSSSRVKMPISRNEGELELRQQDDERFEIVRDEKVLVSDVTLQPTLCHAPGQAFVCLGRSCTMGCLYCTINEADEKGKENLMIEKAFDLIMANSKRPDFKAIAITSGISTTIEDQIDQMARLISMIRERLPSIPIGVEPLATCREHLTILKHAGATEAKINLETARREIFKKVCPRRDYEETINSIELAVEEFGPGAVTSNIIIGLGEDDTDICAALEMLADVGAVGNLRKLRTNSHNLERLTSALGEITPINGSRLIRLAKMQEEILRHYGLSTKSFKSMCFSCGCCDLVPGIDL